MQGWPGASKNQTAKHYSSWAWTCSTKKYALNASYAELQLVKPPQPESRRTKRNRKQTQTHGCKPLNGLVDHPPKWNDHKSALEQLPLLPVAARLGFQPSNESWYGGDGQQPWEQLREHFHHSAHHHAPRDSVNTA